MLVIACPKSKYNRKKKRCKVATEVQSVIKKKRLTQKTCPVSIFKGFIIRISAKDLKRVI